MWRRKKKKGIANGDQGFGTPSQLPPPPCLHISAHTKPHFFPFQWLPKHLVFFFPPQVIQRLFKEDEGISRRFSVDITAFAIETEHTYMGKWFLSGLGRLLGSTICRGACICIAFVFKVEVMWWIKELVTERLAFPC